jgi:hypothetical protein
LVLDLLDRLDLADELQLVFLQLVSAIVEFLLVATELVVPFLTDDVQSLLAEIFVVLIKLCLGILLLRRLLSCLHIFSQLFGLGHQWLGVSWSGGCTIFRSCTSEY